MIILQNLKWDNCFSYGEGNELDLDSSTLTQIIGTNGMGKSSIPLIIEEVLYNKNSKGIKKIDIPNRYTNKGYTIYLSFSKDGLQYEITVTRKTNIKVVLLKEGDDISSHTSTNTYKTIQSILGLDFKTFSQLVYQNTNASLQFLTATDANRKKFLIDLLQLERYVDLFEIFKTAHKDVTIDSSSASASLNTVSKWLENNKLEHSSILPMLDLKNNTSEDDTLARSLTIQISNILENNNKIIKNNEYRTMLQGIDIVSLNASKEVFTVYDPLVSQYGEQKALAAGSERTLKKLEKLEQVCPTCSQAISYSFKQSMISEAATKSALAKENIYELDRRIKSIKAENTKFESNTKSIQRLGELVPTI